MSTYHLAVTNGANDWEVNDLVGRIIGVRRLEVSNGKAHLDIAVLGEWLAASQNGLTFHGDRFTFAVDGKKVAEIYQVS